MKARWNLFGIALAVIALAGCGVMRPRLLHHGWQWDGVFRVMPNSLFEPVAKAKEVSVAPTADAAVPAASRHEEFSLNGLWRYRPDAEERGEAEAWFGPSFDDSGWKTMAVPNNFSIDDLSLKNFFQPVWFRRSFEVPASMSGKRLRLVFESVDYFAKVWLNDELLGEHEGYFNPLSFEITAKVRPGPNLLVVKVTNPWDMGLQVAEEEWSVELAEKVWVKSVFSYHDSRPGGYSFRAQDSQSFGTGGICRPVKLVATGDAAIAWVLISPKLLDNYTRAEVAFDIFVTNFTNIPQAALVQIQAQGENFEGYSETLAGRVMLPPGPNKVRLTLLVDQPRLWWPWDHPELGAPSLYRARAVVSIGDQAADEQSHVFGIKEVKLTETGPEAFFWSVNGRRLSLRGTNGIPTEYYSKITPEYLADYFRLLKANNMDVLIIHDHQAPPMVYEWADREGMVILQNFTLIWEVNVCDFIRPNGDPELTNNAEVIGRMAIEALWYLYNHPSIFWWSMHDESGHIGLNEHGLLPGNWCREEPFRPGEKFPMIQDLSLNLNLDNELIRIAKATNPTIPMHRTGGRVTDSTTWYGWYKETYFDLIRDPEAFPLEFGGEAVSYSMPGVMNYYPELWPLRDDQIKGEWLYHALEVPFQETYIGRSVLYPDFNSWAFASQLYQAVVIKYHIEINRENKYRPTGSVLQYMFNDWWPSVNFGFTDWNLEEKISLAWIKRAFTPQLVATRVDRNIYSQREQIQIPLYLMNDQHVGFSGAKVKWRLVEETDSFIFGGYRQSGKLNITALVDPIGAIRSTRLVPITATIGHQVPIATVLSDEITVNLPADEALLATVVTFAAPETEQPRHYTLYMTLTAADGQVLSENWDHFLVVPNARKFKPAEGITPAPRFSLEMRLSRLGRPLADSKVVMVDQYNSENSCQTQTDEKGQATLAELLPGAYRLEVAGQSYEFLLNRDERLAVDFRPGLKTTLGVQPIIAWDGEMQRP